MTLLKSSELISYRNDERFSCAVASPLDATTPIRGLVVGVHDSERQWEGFLDGFEHFAAEHHFAIVAPVFPKGPLGDGNPDGYKFLIEGELRYDLILNGLLEQAAQHFACTDPTVVMHGYSGGAQFVHRYLLLHADRLAAVSIASPGEVTLPDQGLDWWGGVRNAAAVFDRSVDWSAVSRVAIHLAVGERDTSLDQLIEQPPSRFWVDDRQRLKANRRDRLATLHRALRDTGVMSQFEVLAGAEHSDGQQPAMARASAFFQRSVPARCRPAAGFMARTVPKG